MKSKFIHNLLGAALSLVLMVSNSVMAEDVPDLNCDHELVTESLLARSPETAAELKAHNAKAAKGGFDSAIGAKALDSNPTYVIPVVFHVYGTNFNGKSVTNAIIQNGLTKTNEDFQGEAVDWNQVVSQFAGVKDTLSVEFRLAKIDPNGNATTGVVYHANQAGFGNDSGYDHLIAADAWDNYKYMNVYIQNDLKNDGKTNNSGVAWFPSTSMSNADTARVVYNGAYIGSNTDENFRSVLTHEFGHWLNLHHTFNGGCSASNENACSTTGDQICDTPQVDNSSLQTANNCMGQLTNWQNFMHYADQYANYTQNQVTRMKAAMNHAARQPLWQQSNLVATGVATSGGSSSGGSSSGGSSSGGSSSGGALSNGQTVTGLSAAQNQRTANYYIDVPTGATNLTIKITPGSGATGDADLFVKKGSVPTDTSYDCRPWIGGNTETCGTGGTALATSAGRFHINVRAYSTFTNVNLTASYTAGGSSSGGSSSGGSSSGGSSSGGSSSGGSSSGGSSSGGSSSGGLSNGQTVTGISGAQNAFTSAYYIDVPSGATNLTIKIAAGSGATGDADLYVKKGSVPTTSSYDCRPYIGGNAETCGTGGTALATSAGRFYINLRGYSAFTNVNLTASYTGGGSSSGGSSSGGSSSGGSSSGGSSSGGSVVNACATEAAHTASSVSANDTICLKTGTGSNSIAYHYIQVPANTSSMTIKTAHGTGNGNLYYNAPTWATSSANSQSSTGSGNTESITVNNPAAGYRFFSVVGQQAGMSLIVELQ